MNYDVILPIAIAISTMLFVVKLQKPPKPMNFFRGWMYAISILLGMISIGLINNYQDLFLQNDILLLRWQDTLIFIVLFLITAWGVISGGLLIIDKHPWGWILVVLLILLRQTVIQWMKIGEVDYLPTLIALAGGAIVGLAWRRFWTIMDKNGDTLSLRSSDVLSGLLSYFQTIDKSPQKYILVLHSLFTILFTMKNFKELFKDEVFTKEDIVEAALIIHPKVKDYNIVADEIACVFKEGSNFTPLQTPIKDEFGNEFLDSEGYYMAKRTKDLNIKKVISALSVGYSVLMKARDLYPQLRKDYTFESDPIKRIEYMRDAIQQKFDNNPLLKEKLLSTGDRQIIEYTYWGDIFFGIDQNTLSGKNILGKLLMEYRDTNR